MPFLLPPKTAPAKNSPSPTPQRAKTASITLQAVTERQTVFFDFNSYVLKPAEKLKLDRLDKKSVVDVVGYTDDKGATSYNDDLAFKRAAAVVSYLGISIPFEGKGKCCYVSEDKQNLNRRVEIDTKLERSITK